MLLILAIAAGAVSYYPPSSDEATRAIATRIAMERYGDDATAFGGAYPANVRLECCESVAERAVRTPHGLWRSFSGYACVLTVALEDSPDAIVEGFFHFDGVDWAYYGPLRPSLVIEPETFDQYRKGSTQTAKTGSILYAGKAGGDLQNPYDRILQGSDAFLEPAEQPYHADIYSSDD